MHPYLAGAAAVAARWAGRESFHAGAVMIGGGAWVVLGNKENGKSTTLAWLALNGHTVLTDDLLVIDRDLALAGPRCIDLRRESSERLGVGEPLGIVGQRERWRFMLGGAPAMVPLRGFIALSWDDSVALERVRGAHRLLALLPGRSVRLPPTRPADLVALEIHAAQGLRAPEPADQPHGLDHRPRLAGRARLQRRPRIPHHTINARNRAGLPGRVSSMTCANGECSARIGRGERGRLGSPSIPGRVVACLASQDLAVRSLSRSSS